MAVVCVAFLLLAFWGCSDNTSQIWYYGESDPNIPPTDSTRQLPVHDRKDSLVGKGIFVSEGTSHVLKAYSNAHYCPHDDGCSMTLELDEIGEFYGRSLDDGACGFMRSNNDSLNQLIILATRAAMKEGFLSDRLFTRFLPLYGYEDSPSDSIPDMSEVDVIPAFPGGSDSLLGHMNRAQAYPGPGWQAGLRGYKSVSFVVGEKGEISNIEVQWQGGPEFDDAAIKMIRSMPVWVPARKAGQAIKCRVVLSTYFK